MLRPIEVHPLLALGPETGLSHARLHGSGDSGYAPETSGKIRSHLISTSRVTASLRWIRGGASRHSRPPDALRPPVPTS